MTFERAIRARFEGDGDLDDVPALIWRAADGSVHANPGPPEIVEDLDDLPMPAYDLIDLPAYWRHQTIAPMIRRKYVSLLTSRGCPFRCIYCHNIFGKRLRMHSAERVVDEIAWFTKKYQIDDVEFIDDLFNVKPARTFEVSELLRRRDIHIRLAIPNGIRADLLSPEVADALVDAGLYHCMIALESGSDRVQRLIRKNLNIPKFLEACEDVSRHGVYVHTCCMLGFPTETEAELQQTIDVACEAKTHTTSFFTVIPFPGTSLYDLAKEHCPEKLPQVNYDNATYNTIKVNLTDLPDEVLFAYQRKAVLRYFLNPARIARLILNYPAPWLLPLYAPILISRALRGI